MTAALALQAAQIASFIIAIAILLWQFYLDRRIGKELNSYLLSIAYAIIISSIFALFFNHIATMLLIFGVALVACSSFYQYLKHRVAFSVSILYLFVVITYFFLSNLMPEAGVAAQSMAIGLIAALMAKGRAPKPLKKTGANRRTEIRRDIFEIAMGLVLLAIVLSVGYHSALYLIILLLLLGYSVSGLISKRMRVYSLLNALERGGDFFGEGAVYLAVGTLLIAGFVRYNPLLITGIIVLFLSDPIATIFGTLYGRHKLPYNRSKSIEGTFMFLASTAIIAFPFVGVYSIPIGATLALIESASGRRTIDDNISIAIGMITIYAIALLII